MSVKLSVIDTATVQRIALAIIATSRRDFALWEEACEADRRNGHRPHYCRHGRNMWVDHDIACGECEDLGYYHWEYLGELSAALATAKGFMSQVHKRRDMVVPLILDNAPVSADLWVWTNEPIAAWAA